jgi:D-alanine-D-alanine ligase
MSIIKPDHKTYSVDNVKPPGPVSNLEKYVKPDWWRYLFNPIYLKTDADVVNDQSITRSEVDLLIQILRLLPKDKILDLCCGHGRHSLELARRGFLNVDGLDFSHYLIQKAKKECLKECLNVKFKKGDARKLPYQPNTFDVVMLLGNSFGYFERPHDDMKVLREIYRVLRPCGRFLIDIADGEYLKEHFQPRSWEWIDNKYFACRERSLSQDKQRLITREIVNHVKKGVIVDQFYAERLILSTLFCKFLYRVYSQRFSSSSVTLPLHILMP